jgi:hypothetical protein
MAVIDELKDRNTALQARNEKLEEAEGIIATLLHGDIDAEVYKSALAFLAPTEAPNLSQALHQAFEKLAASQEPLGPDFQKVLDDHFWELTGGRVEAPDGIVVSGEVQEPTVVLVRRDVLHECLSYLPADLKDYLKAASRYFL